MILMIVTYANDYIYYFVQLSHTILWGSRVPHVVHLHFKAKRSRCTHAGGANHLLSRNCCYIYIYICFGGIILQIPVLSSNTKKGEIERTFPSFCVLDDNNGDQLTACQSAAVKHILHSMTSGLSPVK